MISRGSKKDKRPSKSIQRKHSVKKQTTQTFFSKETKLKEKISVKAESTDSMPPPPSKITDRSKAKSSLAGRIDNNKISQKIDVNLKISSIKNWMQEQLMTTKLDKPSRKNYDYMHVIGKGGFGKVYKVKQKKTGELFAMKQMSKAVILAKKSNESIRNERQLLRILKHKFIVNMRNAFQDRDNLYLIMDLMPGGDLRYHICRKHKFTQQQARFFTACIFTALEYTHSQKIIHRDIKPQNLVFDSQGYLHLTDLGIAKYYREDNYADTSGTPGYMAPEVMTKQNHSYQVDYYALGVIIYELMMGKRPYVGRDRKVIREQILAKQSMIKKSEIPQGWSMQAADFVNKLIQRRPMMRLGWGGSQQIREHAWLRDFPWKKLLNGQLQSPFKAYSKYSAQDVRYLPTKEDEQMSNLIRQNKMLLRKSSVQDIFQGYTFVQSDLKQQNYTTSSELYRKRDTLQVVDL